MSYLTSHSKAVATCIALLTAPHVSSQETATLPAEPPIPASATDLTAPKTPSLQATQENPRNTKKVAVTLRSGFVIEQREGSAHYTIDSQGRVASIAFPNGYTISKIAYYAKPEIDHLISSITISTGKDYKVYTRNSHGSTLYYTWSVRGSNAATFDDFVGEFSITPCGEFAITNLSQGSTGTQLFTSNGKAFGMKQLPSGGYMLFHKDGKVHALRRRDLSLVTVTYAGEIPVKITEALTVGDTRVWNFDRSSGSWRCSDSKVAPSSETPLLEKGTLSYVMIDGTKVTTATSGAQTICHADGTRRILDWSGKLVRLAKGARSREFSYSGNGELIEYKDKVGSRETSTLIAAEARSSCRVEPDGSVTTSRPITTPLEAPEVTRLAYPPPRLTAIAPSRLKLPPMQVHPHDPRAGVGRNACLDGICPTTPPPSGQTEVLLPVESIAVGQETLAPPRIQSWTSLDSIEKHRNGILAPVVEFLRVWANTTSDEDIEALTSPDMLTKLRSTNGAPWISSDLLGPDSADYLIWLRDCVRANKLPCSLDVKPLTYPGLTDQRTHGGVTSVGADPIDGSLEISVDLQSLLYGRDELRADIDAMLKHGGTGVFRPEGLGGKSVFEVVFHELQHVFVYTTGREFEGGEPIAHLGAFLGLLSITPEKAKKYEHLVDRFPRQ